MMEVFSINQNTEEMNCTILVIAMVLLRSKLSRLVENTKKTRAFSESLDLIGELLDKYGFTGVRDRLGVDYVSHSDLEEWFTSLNEALGEMTVEWFV